MNRPLFNRFATGNPTDDYNERMRKYVFYLEGRDKKCSRLETERWEVSRIAENLHKTMEEAHGLRTTLKILRSQIKHMWKENQCRLSESNVMPV